MTGGEGDKDLVLNARNEETGEMETHGLFRRKTKSGEVKTSRFGVHRRGKERIVRESVAALINRVSEIPSEKKPGE